MKKAVELRYNGNKGRIFVLYPMDNGLFDIRVARGTCNINMRGGFERYLREHGNAAKTNTLADATHEKWYRDVSKREAREMVAIWRKRAEDDGLTIVEKW
jgi:hypothetical protein